MYYLTEEIVFPEVTKAYSDGLLAIGGNLSVERLILAYSKGIFPWYDETQPILWWSPDPRFVIFPEQFKVSKSTRQILRKNIFKVTVNESFGEVVNNCALIPRKDQNDTWITQEMKDAYNKLHLKGYATSIEVWNENVLVGGLYGVDLGNGVFCGESMFSKQSNASKVALIHLVQLKQHKLIDCQMYTEHLASMGAVNISRSKFIRLLN